MGCCALPVVQGASGRDEWDYDLIVIGGGSAGFAAVIRAAQEGARVALVNAGTIGGTCVNVGCVPSKTLIRAAEIHHLAAHQPFAGIRTQRQDPDFSAAVAQKDALVERLRKEKYTDVLAAYPQVDWIRGRARFVDTRAVEVNGQVLRARKFVVTTGARPLVPPIPGLQDADFWTSTEALAAGEVPESLLVVGGSAVGVELGQMFARLGSRVTIVEMQSTLVPAEDPEIGEELRRHLEAEGIEVRTGSRVQRVEQRDGRTQVEVDAGGTREWLVADRLLVAAGRRPNSDDLGLEAAGIEVDRQGFIRVDATLRTSNEHVYAAGDVALREMFVYVAAYTGGLAAANALRPEAAKEADLGAVPHVTFTDPQVASVGLTEATARERGLEVRTTVLPLEYVPRALVNHDTRGLIKLVAEGESLRIVGVHVVAPEAGELIQPGVLAVRYGLTVEDLKTTLFPYLTFVEGLKLAAQTFDTDVRMLSCCAG